MPRAFCFIREGKMYTKEINGKLYDFNFGLGFVREIDRRETIQDNNKKTQNVGLSYAIAGLVDGDFEKYIDCMLAGNKFSNGEKLTRPEIENWMESDDFDFEKECTDLLDFFGKCNFTKKKTESVVKEAERIREYQEAQHQARMVRLGNS